MLKRMRTYLRVIFAIFARDVKRVLHNPVALVIALGMIVMPSAYAWYVVVANWDPYSNTTGMLVAVANEDAGADSPETGHLDVGAQVVAQLHDNHEMGWEFTDAEAAINGVLRDATGRRSSSRRISAPISPACSPATLPSRPSTTT